MARLRVAMVAASLLAATGGSVAVSVQSTGAEGDGAVNGDLGIRIDADATNAAKERTTRQSGMTTYGLQDAYGSAFDIGVSIIKPEEQLTGRKGEIVDQNFKVLVAENIMTWQYLQPKEGEFSWKRPDMLVDWAEQHNKTVVGHTLLWNEASWMVKNQTKAALLRRIEKHIKTVVGRYKGRVKVWNVVNEFFADEGNFRTDFVIPKVLREEGIIKAFQWAHETDPEAELFLNEYHMYLPDKATMVVNFVRRLRAIGVPVHGIGIQGHQYHVDNSTGGTARAPTIADFEDALLKCARAGVKCWITELDVTVLPNKWKCCKGTSLSDYSPELQAEYNPYVNGVPDDVMQLFNNRYRDFFAMMLRLPGKVQSVQFWGLTDVYSWYNSRPIRGRTDYPLLWDRSSNPKDAYHMVMGLRGY